MTKFNPAPEAGSGGNLPGSSLPCRAWLLIEYVGGAVSAIPGWHHSPPHHQRGRTEPRRPSTSWRSGLLSHCLGSCSRFIKSDAESQGHNAALSHTLLEHTWMWWPLTSAPLFSLRPRLALADWHSPEPATGRLAPSFSLLTSLISHPASGSTASPVKHTSLSS